MTESHKSAPTPSPSLLLALVALGIVARLRPAWLGVDLKAAAVAEHQSAERVCRLVSRAIACFEPLLETLTRRGRPSRDAGQDDRDAELSLTRELLSVASAVLATLSVRRVAVRSMLVGAWQRLSSLPLAGKMTQARFCQALGLPERTLRAWIAAPPRPVETTPVATPDPTPQPSPPPRSRPARRRRFGFDVTMPGAQVGADTTDLCAFGVPLKLVAAQDIGGRDAQLFDAVVVDDHESAEIVARVFGGALRDRAGAQALTDQGTPFMAAHTRAALEALGVEHAPQREGDPCGKSTVERAFRSLKDIARPLLSLTDRIAAALPTLCNGELAKAAATIVITALLRAYQHGGRAGRAASNARGGLDPDTIAERVADARDQARATDTSARLLLAHIHEIYGITRSLRRFVDSLRRYPVPVLREAERMLATQVHRDDIRDRASYFAALVRRAFVDHRHERERTRHLRADVVRSRADARAARARHHAFRANPVVWMRGALDMIASQWIAPNGSLLFDGIGPALGTLRAALARIVLAHGAATRDIADGVWLAFASQRAQGLGVDALVAIEAIVRREIHHAATARPTPTVATTDGSAILRSTGRLPRPPPSDRLRI